MSSLRQRPAQGVVHDPPAPTDSSFPPKPSPPPRTSLLIAIAIFLIALIVTSLLRPKRSFFPLPLLPPGTPSDDEAALSAHSIPLEDFTPAAFHESILACMPTVTRRNGRVEYVSNAVKSWRLATNGSAHLRRLVVYDMDEKPAERPAWVRKVFGGGDVQLPSWLSVQVREERPVMPPRKETLGDSKRRVAWRSKEVLDYVEILRRCAEETEADYIMVVQDDVLFTGRIQEVFDWCERELVDLVVEKDGRRKMQRVCSASLFDVAEDEEDAHLLRSSNMVARVWDVDRIPAVYRYLFVNYDEAPVDWLADRSCKGQSRRTLVMEPNPVRHRGRVSSFSENNREGLLT